MKKSTVTVSCVAVVLALMWSPAAMAAMAEVWAELAGPGSGAANVPSLTATYLWSSSSASVGDSLGGGDGDSQSFDLVADTSATVDILSASGSAHTASFHTSANSIAAPPAGVQSYSGYNEAVQDWEFYAEADGMVSFNFGLNFGMNLQTSVPGERALGEVHLYASIDSDSGSNFSYQQVSFSKEVLDGTAFTLSRPNDSFAGTFFFSAGETLYVSIGVLTYAEATSVVPVPTAVLLGFLGLGTAGIGLRKLT